MYLLVITILNCESQQWIGDCKIRISIDIQNSTTSVISFNFPVSSDVSREMDCSLSMHIKGACKKDRERLFIRACSDRTRGNGFKLKKGRFRLGIRKKFFITRAVRHWHRLPRGAVAAPSLAVFKARLDGAVSNLG